MTEQPPPPAAPRPPGPPRSRSPLPTWVVATAAGLGATMVILAIVAFGFIRRLDSYVEVVGTVQAIHTMDELSQVVDPTMDLSTLEGTWILEVKYQLSGNQHVGILFTAREYAEGDPVLIEAPSSGSAMEALRSPASGGVKATSWLLMIGGLALTVASTVLLVRRMIARDRSIRAGVAAALAAAPPPLPWFPPQWNPNVRQLPQLPPSPPTSPHQLPGSGPRWLDSHGPGLSAPPSYEAPSDPPPGPRA